MLTGSESHWIFKCIIIPIAYVKMYKLHSVIGLESLSSNSWMNTEKSVDGWPLTLPDLFRLSSITIHWYMHVSIYLFLVACPLEEYIMIRAIKANNILEKSNTLEVNVQPE